jgi:hypothetical protein
VPTQPLRRGRFDQTATIGAVPSSSHHGGSPPVKPRRDPSLGIPPHWGSVATGHEASPARGVPPSSRHSTACDLADEVTRVDAVRGPAGSGPRAGGAIRESSPGVRARVRRGLDDGLILGASGGPRCACW